MTLVKIMENWLSEKTGYKLIEKIGYHAGDYRFTGFNPEGKMETVVYCSHRKELTDRFCDVERLGESAGSSFHLNLSPSTQPDNSHEVIEDE